MDFRTKNLSRQKIRSIAGIIRKGFFGCADKFYFDVVSALELVPIRFKNVTVQIVEDGEPDMRNVPATTILTGLDNYVIKVKNSVYEGAYFSKNGAFRMHIMHEICHVILFCLGFLPCFDRTFRNNELRACQSIEWQAKALAGEILIPYDATKGMSEAEIVERCSVSRDAASFRTRIEEKTSY